MPLPLLLAALAAQVPMPMQEFSIPTPDGASLHARVVGSGPDTVVIPFGTLLSPTFDGLARGRTVVYYDMRGRGRSAAVADTLLGTNRDVDDLETVRRHFAIGRMALIGFSYLGDVVALYAADHPERVARLVQLGPGIPRSDAPYAQTMTTLAASLDPGSLAAFQALTASGVATADPERYCKAFWETYAPLYVGSAEGKERLLAVLAPTCALPNEHPFAFFRTLQHVVAAVQPWDWRDLATRVAAPTLIVQGRLDRVAPFDGAVEWAQGIPDSRLLVIEDAGHAAWAEYPEQVLGAIEEFLQARWPTGATRP